MTKLSVITPIYKTEEFLDKCLPSLMKQTLKDIEFIWIDNGASDECRRLMDKYKDERVKVISLTENIGYMGALNTGLNEATGEYIGFCDSDDWVDDDYFEKLYETAKKDDAEICFGGWIFYCGKKNIKTYLRTYKTPEKQGDAFDALQNGAIWKGIYANSLIKKHHIRFPQSNKSIYRDNLFLIQAVLLAQKVCFCKEAFYNYFTRIGSTTHQLSKETQKEECFQILREISDKIIDLPQTKVCLPQLTQFLCRSLFLYVFSKEELLLIPLMQKYLSIVEAVDKYRAYKKPSFRQRLFSLSENAEQTRYKLRFLGISISFKYMRGEKI